jgi:hypothetical protein
MLEGHEVPRKIMNAPEIHATSFDPIAYEKRKRDGLLRCRFCVYFQPKTDYNGECKLMPQTVEKDADNWCGQFRGKGSL